MNRCFRGGSVRVRRQVRRRRRLGAGQARAPDRAGPGPSRDRHRDSAAHASSGAMKEPRAPYPGAGILDRRDLARRLYRANFVWPPARRWSDVVCIEQLGPFVEGLACEDYDFWLRAVAAGAVFFHDPSMLVKYSDCMTTRSRAICCACTEPSTRRIAGTPSLLDDARACAQNDGARPVERRAGAERRRQAARGASDVRGCASPASLAAPLAWVLVLDARSLPLSARRWAGFDQTHSGLAGLAVIHEDRGARDRRGAHAG